MTELGIRNRRNGNRLTRTLPVRVAAPGLSSTPGMTVNVSPSGARLVIREKPPETFWMQLDAQTEVAARPVWSQKLQRSTVVGVRFEFRCERERRRWIRFLQKLA